jgi:DNA-binding NarL/FixJ family response regulator
LYIFRYIKDMEGLTVAEIAQMLGISEGAVRMRLSRAGIKPITHSPVYPVDAVEAIREAPMGRPLKGSKEEDGTG